MKIKTLLVCFLAVCAMSLTSCNKGKYVESYVGTYNMSIASTLTMSLSGEEKDLSTEPISGFVCVITQVGNSAEVTVTISENKENATPVFVADAECDETGMHINSVVMNETMSDETLGDMQMNINIGATTVLEPVNGQISWESNVGGTVETSLMGIKIEVPLSGKVSFAGTKIV